MFLSALSQLQLLRISELGVRLLGVLAQLCHRLFRASCLVRSLVKTSAFFWTAVVLPHPARFSSKMDRPLLGKDLVYFKS